MLLPEGVEGLVHVSDMSWAHRIQHPSEKVTVGQDLGQRLEIVDGLASNERIVTNPGEKLVEGIEVRVADAPEQKQPAVADANESHSAGNDPAVAVLPTTRVAQGYPDPVVAGSGGGSR